MIVDVIVSISGFLGFHGKLSILDSLLKNKTSRQKAAAFIPPPKGGGSSRGGFIKHSFPFNRLAGGFEQVFVNGFFVVVVVTVG